MRGASGQTDFRLVLELDGIFFRGTKKFGTESGSTSAKSPTGDRNNAVSPTSAAKKGCLPLQLVLSRFCNISGEASDSPVQAQTSEKAAPIDPALTPTLRDVFGSEKEYQAAYAQEKELTSYLVTPFTGDYAAYGPTDHCEAPAKKRSNAHSTGSGVLDSLGGSVMMKSVPEAMQGEPAGEELARWHAKRKSAILRVNREQLIGTMSDLFRVDFDERHSTWRSFTSVWGVRPKDLASAMVRACHGIGAALDNDLAEREMQYEIQRAYSLIEKLWNIPTVAHMLKGTVVAPTRPIITSRKASVTGKKALHVRNVFIPFDMLPYLFAMLNRSTYCVIWSKLILSIERSVTQWMVDREVLPSHTGPSVYREQKGHVDPCERHITFVRRQLEFMLQAQHAGLSETHASGNGDRIARLEAQMAQLITSTINLRSANMAQLFLIKTLRLQNQDIVHQLEELEGRQPEVSAEDYRSRLAFKDPSRSKSKSSNGMSLSPSAQLSLQTPGHPTASERVLKPAKDAVKETAARLNESSSSAHLDPNLASTKKRKRNKQSIDPFALVAQTSNLLTNMPIPPVTDLTADAFPTGTTMKLQGDKDDMASEHSSTESMSSVLSASRASTLAGLMS